MHTTLISTDMLGQHLDGSWAIVDCRYDLHNDPWGLEQYRGAHIPGAVYASLSRDLSGPLTGANGRHPLPCVEDVEATFARFGISSGTQVVMYDQDTGMYASRMWWMLRYLGHDAAAVLDGGWAKWVREQRPVTGGDETRPTGTFTAHRRKELRVLVDRVQASVGDPSALLVDARAPERFEGITEPLDRAAGHIPGAVNYFFRRNVADDGVMLSPEILRQQFADVVGDRSAAEVVMYCGSGVSACHNLLAMEHAGLPGAKLYVGSWSEWSAEPERPVETGTGASSKYKLQSEK